MNPLRAKADHELGFLGKSPRLLEEKVGIPFCGAAGEKRRNARLKFQPVFYRRNFDGDVRPEARSAVTEIPGSGSPKLKDGGRLLLDGLREGVYRAETQR